MLMPLRNRQNGTTTKPGRTTEKRGNLVLRTVIALGVVCALIVGYNLLGKYVFLPNLLKSMKQPAVTVAATPAQAVTWTPGIEAVGTAKAVRGVDVASELDGVVKEIPFKSNDMVEAGQLLVQIDDSVERADLIAAEANIRLYEAQLARVAELKRKGVNSQASLDDAHAQLDVARSNYQSLEATIEKKAISAPFAGKVGIARVDVGEYVKAGTAVVTLQDLSRIKVDLTVPEQLASEIEVGRRAQFGETFDALDFTGAVTGIDPKVDPETRLVAVQAEVDNSSGRIRPGQFLRVRIDLPTRSGVIAVPQSAVIPSLYGDYVYVAQPAEASVDDDKGAKDAAAAEPAYTAAQVFVKQGRRSGAMVEIESGLKGGEMVVISGQNKLFPGAPVAINNSIDLDADARASAGEIQ